MPSDADAATAIRPRITGIKPLTKEVYGYLPYWRLDSGTADRLHYDYVSTIAFFGLGILANGNIDTSWVGYKEYVGDDAAAVTNAAHDKGVRVVPTFQLFDSGALHKMTAFLGSDAAQATFIAQALDLMAARKADGANLDFEPMSAADDARRTSSVRGEAACGDAGPLPGLHPGQLHVRRRGRGARRRPRPARRQADGDDLRLPDGDRHGRGRDRPRSRTPPATSTSTSPASSSRRRPSRSCSACRTTASTGRSPRPSRTPPSRRTRRPTAPAKSITYAAARDYLAAHPTIVRHHDTVEGSAYYIYRDAVKKTYREVYFDDEVSLAAKYDYALVKGLGGIGIWTLDNDRGYGQLWNVLRAKFYAPIRCDDRDRVDPPVCGGPPASSAVIVHGRVRNTGTVPVTGRWWWSIRDPGGHTVLTGSWPSSTIYPGRALSHGRLVRLGLAQRLPAGTLHAATHLQERVARAGARRSSGSASRTDRGPDEIRRPASQHRGPVPRLLAMHAPIRPVASLALRSALMVALAMTLILVVLPMILSVEASSS